MCLRGGRWDLFDQGFSTQGDQYAPLDWGLLVEGFKVQALGFGGAYGDNISVEHRLFVLEPTLLNKIRPSSSSRIA